MNWQAMALLALFACCDLTPALANKLDGKPKRGDCESAECRQNYGLSDGRQQGRAGGGNPCAADAMRFCASAGADRSARMKCMREHRSELSPACLQAAAQRRTRQ